MALAILADDVISANRARAAGHTEIVIMSDFS